MFNIKITAQIVSPDGSTTFPPDAETIVPVNSPVEVFKFIGSHYQHIIDAIQRQDKIFFEMSFTEDEPRRIIVQNGGLTITPERNNDNGD